MTGHRSPCRKQCGGTSTSTLYSCGSSFPDQFPASEKPALRARSCLKRRRRKQANLPLSLKGNTCGSARKSCPSRKERSTSWPKTFSSGLKRATSGRPVDPPGRTSINLPDGVWQIGAFPLPWPHDSPRDCLNWATIRGPIGSPLIQGEKDGPPAVANCRLTPPNRTTLVPSLGSQIRATLSLQSWGCWISQTPSGEFAPTHQSRVSNISETASPIFPAPPVASSGPETRQPA